MFLRRHPLCNDPFKVHADEKRFEPATLVDHIKSHKGDKGLFWDPANLQSLCAACHNRKTALESGFGREVRSA